MKKLVKREYFDNHLAYKGIDKPKVTEPIPNIGIACDCSYSFKQSYVEYQCIDLATKEVLFNQRFENLTSTYVVNIGEFLALAWAVKYVIENNIETPIYSDSRVAIWWAIKREGKTNCKEDLLPLMEEANKYLKSLLNIPRFTWWDKYKWGENPADFGRK